MPARTALLIGNQVFRNDSGLAPLHGPHNDVAALSRVLGDPQFGDFAIRQFLDQTHYDILPPIAQTLRNAKRGDLVLIYYSGHGVLDHGGRVCLATKNTQDDALEVTSISARHLQDLVNQSNCDQVVLLLDCCYSGALDEMRGGDVVSEMRVIEDAQGFFILTASTGLEASREEVLKAGGVLMGKFTAALVEGIETGAADHARKGRVMLSDLKIYLERVVSGQTPQFFARRAVGDPLISLGPWTPGPLLDQSIPTGLDLINRRHTVFSLLETLREGSPATQRAATATLKYHLRTEQDRDIRQTIEEALPPEPLTVLAETFMDVPFIRRVQNSVADVGPIRLAAALIVTGVGIAAAVYFYIF